MTSMEETAEKPTVIEVENGSANPRRAGRRKRAGSSSMEKYLWGIAFTVVMAIFMTLSPAMNVVTNALGSGLFFSQRSKAFMHGETPTIVWTAFLAGNSQDPFTSRNIRDAALAWKTMNPEWQYRILDEREARDIIDRNIADDLGWIYDELKTRRERDILLKLAVMYDRGGVFTDMNIKPKQPIRDWIPEQCKFAVGYENDKHLSLVTISSAPRHRVITRVFNEIMALVRLRLEEEDREADEPLITDTDFTSAVSMALVGEGGKDAEQLWDRRANIVKADPSTCLFKSRTSLHRTLVTRYDMEYLYAPDPTPRPTPSPKPEEPEEEEAAEEAEEDPNAFPQVETNEEMLARINAT